MNNFSVNFNKKKFGLVILSVVVIGILLAVLFQPETNPSNSSLEVINGTVRSSLEKIYGTISSSSGLPVMGSPNALVTIMAFGDYQCPSCRDWFLNTRPNITKNFIETGMVNLVFVDADLLGNDSLLAAEASYCAEEQGKYWEYHGLLFNSQQGIDDGWANSKSLKAFANDLQLDLDLFENCLDSRKFEKKVKFNAFEAKKNGIIKTPTFIILDSEGRHHIITGTAPYPVYEKIIESFSQDK